MAASTELSTKKRFIVALSLGVRGCCLLAVVLLNTPFARPRGGVTEGTYVSFPAKAASTREKDIVLTIPLGRISRTFWGVALLSFCLGASMQCNVDAVVSVDRGALAIDLSMQTEYTAHNNSRDVGVGNQEIETMFSIHGLKPDMR